MESLGPETSQIVINPIKRPTLEETSTSKIISFGIIPPIKTFTGRRQEIETLFHHLENPDVDVVVISGIGGQGKTQLSRQFLKIHFLIFLEKRLFRKARKNLKANLY